MMVDMEITPQELKRRLDAGEKIHLLDVREPSEHAMARIDSAELMPMRSVPQHLAKIEAQAGEAPVVVLCHHGIRSLQVASWLRNQGIENCFSLKGGIDLWSAVVDPSVVRY
jgi:rhodanese-related sulfurtransferase